MRRRLPALIIFALVLTVVLRFTVWHPDLAAAERDGIVRLHEALRAAGG